ncbi:hypothetical protein [Streptomyces spiramyceticus]|uniref:hypothetical protein n=1 Tax=Streptomyces spiramyceticus TaxID=299717 RepID=UPI00237A37D0|nr:hypothetical protein [Streptomyces spiramyceticus]
MSQESVPEQAVPQQQPGAPKGLLQQMEELMAALTADISQLDADLQSSGDRPPTAGDDSTGESTGGSTHDNTGSGSGSPVSGRSS